MVRSLRKTTPYNLICNLFFPFNKMHFANTKYYMITQRWSNLVYGKKGEVGCFFPKQKKKNKIEKKRKINQ